MNRLESFNNNTFDQNDDQLNWKSFFTNSDLNINCNINKFKVQIAIQI